MPDQRPISRGRGSSAHDDYNTPSRDTPSSGGRPGCNPATARDGDGDGIVCE